VRLLVILYTKPCTKFEVSSSSSFRDMFDHMPKILGVTPTFKGKFFVCLLGIPPYKVVYDFL